MVLPFLVLGSAIGIGFGDREGQASLLQDESSNGPVRAHRMAGEGRTHICSGKYPSAWMERAKPCCGGVAPDSPHFKDLSQVFHDQLPEHTVASFEPGGPVPVLLDAFVAHTNTEAIFFISARNTSTHSATDDYIDYSSNNVKFSITINAVKVACSLGPAQKSQESEEQAMLEERYLSGEEKGRFWNQACSV
jgi:hypothetical protein